MKSSCNRSSVIASLRTSGSPSNTLFFLSQDLQGLEEVACGNHQSGQTEGEEGSGPGMAHFGLIVHLLWKQLPPSIVDASVALVEHVAGVVEVGGDGVTEHSEQDGDSESDHQNQDVEVDEILLSSLSSSPDDVHKPQRNEDGTQTRNIAEGFHVFVDRLHLPHQRVGFWEHSKGLAFRGTGNFDFVPGVEVGGVSGLSVVLGGE